MLQPVKSSKSPKVSGLDNLGDKKVCSSLLSSASLGGSGVDGDCGAPSSVDLASSNEVCIRKLYAHLCISTESVCTDEHDIIVI